MDPAKFAKRMDWYAKTFEANVEELINKTALTVHSTIVLGTPVDEGRARGSWLVEIGKPAEGMLGKDDKSEFGAVKAIDKARAKLAGNKGKRSALRSQPPIYISNNLPYIIPLNEGHSQQAPAGFVEEAIEAGIKNIKGAKLLGKRPPSTGAGNGD